MNYHYDQKIKIVTTPTGHWQSLPEMEGKGKNLTQGVKMYSDFEQFPHLPDTTDAIFSVIYHKRSDQIFEDTLEELYNDPQKSAEVGAIVDAVGDFRQDLRTNPTKILAFTDYAWTSFRKFITNDRQLLNEIIKCHNIADPDQRIGSIFAYLLKSFWNADKFAYWLTPLEEAKIPRKGFLEGFNPYSEIKTTLLDKLKSYGLSKMETSLILNVGHEPSIPIIVGSCQPDDVSNTALKLSQKTGAPQEYWEICLNGTSRKSLYDRWETRHKQSELLLSRMDSSISQLSQALKNLQNLDHMIHYIEQVPQFILPNNKYVYCWASTSITGSWLLEQLSSYPHSVRGERNLNNFYDSLNKQQIPEYYTSLIGRQAIKYFYPKLSSKVSDNFIEAVERMGDYHE